MCGRTCVYGMNMWMCGSVFVDCISSQHSTQGRTWEVYCDHDAIAKVVLC